MTWWSRRGCHHRARGAGAASSRSDRSPRRTRTRRAALPSGPRRSLRQRHCRRAPTVPANTVNCGGDAADPDSDTVFADRTPADAPTASRAATAAGPPPPPAANNGGTGSGGTTGGGSGDGTGRHYHRSRLTPSPAPVRRARGRSGARARSAAGRRDHVPCGRDVHGHRVGRGAALGEVGAPRRPQSCRASSGPTRAYSLGSLRFTVKGSGKAAARTKLSKKGLSALRKLRTVQTTPSRSGPRATAGPRPRRSSPRSAHRDELSTRGRPRPSRPSLRGVQRRLRRCGACSRTPPHTGAASPSMTSRRPCSS